MKNSIIAVVVLMLLFGVRSLVNAAIVQLPLDCAGVYDFNTPPWTLDFDLGVTFTEISSVYIDWSGEMTGKETMHAGVIDTQFVATLYELDPHDYFGRAYVQGGAETYPEPEPFDLQSTFTTEGWSMLLDGKGSIEILFGETAHPLDVIALSIPSGTLDYATLAVQGNIIPEPGTFLLSVLGAVILRTRYRALSR